MAKRLSRKSPLAILVYQRLNTLKTISASRYKQTKKRGDPSERELDQIGRVNLTALSLAACIDRSKLYSYFRADDTDKMETCPDLNTVMRIIVALGLTDTPDDPAATNMLHSCGYDVSYGKHNEPYRRLIAGPTDAERTQFGFDAEYWAYGLQIQCGIPDELCAVRII